MLNTNIHKLKNMIGGLFKTAGKMVVKTFTAMDCYFDKQHRTRRLLLVLSTMVALFLVVYVNIMGIPLQGETLLTVLVGGGGAAYGTTRYLQSRQNSSTSNLDQEDI